MPFYDQSPLMKRLAELTPKKEPSGWDTKKAMHVEIHPIRQSAESFVHWLDSDLPSNREELHAMLWVFGEILCGEMEARLNHAIRIAQDFQATSLSNLVYLGPIEKEEP